MIRKTEGLDISILGISSPLEFGYIGVELALADSEHFRATGRTDALGRRFPILHGDAFGVFHFLLGMALHAITLHIQASSCFCSDIKPFDPSKSSRLTPVETNKGQPGFPNCP